MRNPCLNTQSDVVMILPIHPACQTKLQSGAPAAENLGRLSARPRFHYRNPVSAKAFL